MRTFDFVSPEEAARYEALLWAKASCVEELYCRFVREDLWLLALPGGAYARTDLRRVQEVYLRHGNWLRPGPWRDELLALLAARVGEPLPEPKPTPTPTPTPQRGQQLSLF